VPARTGSTLTLQRPIPARKAAVRYPASVCAGDSNMKQASAHLP